LRNSLSRFSRSERKGTTIATPLNRRDHCLK